MIDVFGITKMLILSSLGFVLAMLWTPLLTHVLYKYKMGKSIRSAVAAPMFSKLHQKKQAYQPWVAFLYGERCS